MVDGLVVPTLGEKTFLFITDVGIQKDVGGQRPVRDVYGGEVRPSRGRADDFERACTERRLLVRPPDGIDVVLESLRWEETSGGVSPADGRPEGEADRYEVEVGSPHLAQNLLLGRRCETGKDTKLHIARMAVGVDLALQAKVVIHRMVESTFKTTFL